MYKQGIFIEECKHRFLCMVEVEGTEELCYLASSSKLEKFINLKGRKVLLTPNLGKNSRTRYTLHAVITENGLVLVNLNYVNRLLFHEFSKIENRYFKEGKIFCEKKISNKLKADFYIEGAKKIIIEAKGIISEEETAQLPSMKVDRAILQLKQFELLLKKGFDVHYYVVLMSNKVIKIELDKENKEFYRIFRRCMKKGMCVFVYRTIWSGNVCAVEQRPHLEENLRYG